MTVYWNLYAGKPGMSPKLCDDISRIKESNRHPDTFVDKDPETGRLLLGCMACAAWALIEASGGEKPLDITTTIADDCPFENPGL